MPASSSRTLDPRAVAAFTAALAILLSAALFANYRLRAFETWVHEHARPIFEAFEQGDVGVGREFGGTGLGLSISRALCRLLHYELSVASTLGAGSVFRIALVRDAGMA